jgi:hypothetical protein
MALRDLFKDVETNNLLYEISKGKVPTHTSIFKFGENPSVGITEEVIWDGSGDLNFPADDGSDPVTFSSSDVNDTVGGSGAEAVIVFGNDENFNLQSEIVELQGQASVASTKKWSRIWRMSVRAGSQGAQNAVGVIHAGTGAVINGVPNTTFAQIINGNNQTLMCAFTIPNGYSALFVQVGSTVGEGKSALVRIKARDFGQPFSIQGTVRLFEAPFVRNLLLPRVISQKADVVLVASAGAAGTAISADFSVVLYMNDPAATDFVKHSDVEGW